jgi:hypothetical protein
MTTNHLTDELRGILADLDNDPMSGHLEPTTRERLLVLAEHVERLHAEPEPPNEFTNEFTAATSGLDPEQEFRLYGLGEAIRHLAATKQLPKWIRRGNLVVPRVVLDLADHYAGYIRRGQL